MAANKSSSAEFIQLYVQYPLTYLSIADLYTYELLILLMYGIMIIFSFFTNLVAIIIFSLGRRSRSELSPFLLNLSVFNIIMTVYCIPFTITALIFQQWLFARELCLVLDGFKTFSFSGVLLTLIAIAIDRYCAVKYPLTMKLHSVYRRNCVALFVIWASSITLAILWSPARSLAVEQKRLWVDSRSSLKNFIDSIENVSDTSASDYLLEYFRYRVVDTIQCVPNKIERSVEVKRSILNSLQTYFIPLIILAFVYLRIAVILWRRSNHRQPSTNGITITITTSTSSATLKKQSLFTHESGAFKKKLKSGIKMLVAVVILHGILWLPMNVFQLCLNLLCYPPTQYPGFCHDVTLVQLLYIGSHALAVSNTAINPIIYGFANHRFRSDIRQMSHRLIHYRRSTSDYFPAPTSQPAVRHRNGGTVNMNLRLSTL